MVYNTTQHPPTHPPPHSQTSPRTPASMDQLTIKTQNNPKCRLYWCYNRVYRLVIQPVMLILSTPLGKSLRVGSSRAASDIRFQHVSKSRKGQNKYECGLAHFNRYRDILYTNILYTWQSLYELSLYGTKFIRDKVYTNHHEKHIALLYSKRILVIFEYKMRREDFKF